VGRLVPHVHERLGQLHGLGHRRNRARIHALLLRVHQTIHQPALTLACVSHTVTKHTVCLGRAQRLPPPAY
jgi:hypothetical protein